MGLPEKGLVFTMNRSTQYYEIFSAARLAKVGIGSVFADTLLLGRAAGPRYCSLPPRNSVRRRESIMRMLIASDLPSFPFSPIVNELRYVTGCVQGARLPALCVLIVINGC